MIEEHGLRRTDGTKEDQMCELCMKAMPCSGAVHCQQPATEHFQLLAQQHQLAEHWAEGPAVVAPEIGDGLEVRLLDATA
jgi:hypothetical protein